MSRANVIYEGLSLKRSHTQGGLDLPVRRVIGFGELCQGFRQPFEGGVFLGLCHDRGRLAGCCREWKPVCRVRCGEGLREETPLGKRGDFAYG
mmetsp:Transcript_39990/g.64129  ORF Transcript_39990/g.64129 Transcript_39990/m.64129 type:complete len:93 (-) Transcript_39990:579-857(-)